MSREQITTETAQTTAAVANAIALLRLFTHADWEAFAALGILENRITELERFLYQAVGRE